MFNNDNYEYQIWYTSEGLTLTKEVNSVTQACVFLHLLLEMDNLKGVEDVKFGLQFKFRSELGDWFEFTFENGQTIIDQMGLRAKQLEIA